MDINLVSTLIGGGIAGFFSILGVTLAHHSDLAKQRRQDESLLEGFLDAIRTEVETLWERYMDGIGTHLETLPEGQPLLFYYPVTQDYFAIYNENTHLVGKIKDEKLRKLIVTLYIQAKGLVDAYRMNNEMVQKYENYVLLNEQTRHEIFKRQADAQYTVLITYVGEIKKLHYLIKENMHKLGKLLHE